MPNQTEEPAVLSPEEQRFLRHHVTYEFDGFHVRNVESFPGGAEAAMWFLNHLSKPHEPRRIYFPNNNIH